MFLLELRHFQVALLLEDLLLLNLSLDLLFTCVLESLGFSVNSDLVEIELGLEFILLNLSVGFESDLFSLQVSLLSVLSLEVLEKTVRADLDFSDLDGLEPNTPSVELTLKVFLHAVT